MRKSQPIEEAAFGFGLLVRFDSGSRGGPRRESHERTHEHARPSAYCSKSYSTAARHASFGLAPWLRRELRSGKHASQAEQLCTLRSEDVDVFVEDDP